MSMPFVGNYSAKSYDQAKRYRLQSQKGTPLSDSELVEIVETADGFLRQLVANNFPRGSSTNNGFKVVESSISNLNNFTIKGGDSTAVGAGLLFVDGYILFLKSDIEYVDQNDSTTLVNDAYTKTNISATYQLSPPLTGTRTDTVYVDFYFAESSAIGTSEYTDTSLIVSGIGSATANRIRQVQDIRVNIGSLSAPADFTDSNGIFHRCVKIAEIARTTSSSITASMITDKRSLVNSISSYSLGTTITDLVLADGSTIGDDTHRISSIFMQSVIDYKTNDLMFKNDGIETVRFTTAGNVGIGTTNPQANFQTFSSTQNTQVKITSLSVDSIPSLIIQNDVKSWSMKVDGNQFDNFFIRDESAASDRLSIDSTGNVGIGTATPIAKLHVNGNAIIENNLTVNGTTTTINTEATATDMFSITQEENQNALVVSQITPGTNSAVINATNAGIGPIATFVGIGTGTAYVGIGTGTPLSSLHVYGSGSAITGQRTDGISMLVLANSNQSIVSGDAMGGIRMNKNGSYGNLQIAAYYNNTVDPQLALQPSGGNVGIGLTNPLSLLDVNGTIRNRSGGFVLNDGVTTGGSFAFYKTIAGSGVSLEPTIYAEGASGKINFCTGGSATIKMIIDQNGNLGIGSTQPQAKLDVSGDIRISGLTALQMVETDGSKKLISVAKNSGYNLPLGTTAGTIAEGNHNHGTGTTNNIVKFSNGATGAISNSQIIDNGTNVGIGVSPTEKFHVYTTNPSTTILIQSNGLPGSSNKSSLVSFGDSETIKWSVGEIGDNSGSFAIRRESTYQGGSVGNSFLITPAGNVGIGTTNPLSTFHIYHSGSGATFERNNGISTLVLANSNASIAMGDAMGGIRMNKNWSYGNLQIAAYYNNTVDPQLALQPSGGNVGIGTTNPDYALHIYAASPALKIQSSLSNGSPNVYFRRTGAVVETGSIETGTNEGGTGSGDIFRIVNPIASSGHITFVTGGTGAGNERMRIAAGGYVGIGRTNPTAMLQVYGDGTRPGLKTNGGGNSGINLLEVGSGSSTSWSFMINDSARMQLYATATTDNDIRYTTTFSDSSGFNSGVGAGIAFEGQFDSSGNYARFAGIKGIKANSTNANYAGQLHFQTRIHGAVPVTRMAIDENGSVGINITSPQTKLHVVGSTTIESGYVSLINPSISYLYLQAPRSFIHSGDPSRVIHICHGDNSSDPIANQGAYISVYGATASGGVSGNVRINAGSVGVGKVDITSYNTMTLTAAGSLALNSTGVNCNNDINLTNSGTYSVINFAGTNSYVRTTGNTMTVFATASGGLPDRSQGAILNLQKNSGGNAYLQSGSVGNVYIDGSTTRFSSRDIMFESGVRTFLYTNATDKTIHICHGHDGSNPVMADGGAISIAGNDVVGTTGTVTILSGASGNISAYTPNGMYLTADSGISLTGLVRIGPAAFGFSEKVVIQGDSGQNPLVLNASTSGSIFTCTNSGINRFRVDAAGTLHATNATISTPADFAEWVEIVGNKSNYEVGTIVQQSQTNDLFVEIAESNQETIYGIVTDRATFCGALPNAKDDFMDLSIEELEKKYNAKRIAMTGHVQCKVTGTIKRGQKLVMSNIPGVAKAAITLEEKVNSFAIARQNYDSTEIGLIEVRL